MGQEWFESNLNKRLHAEALDPERTMAFGSYGYDWRVKQKADKAKTPADVVTFHDAMQLARDPRRPFAWTTTSST